MQHRPHVNPRIIDKPPGLPTRGTIQSVTSTNAVKVSLDTTGTVVDALYYPAYYGSEGHFIGGRPQPGTPVIIQQGDGGSYYITSVVASTGSIPAIEGKSLVIQSDESNSIVLNPDEFISIGDKLNQLRIDAERNILSNNFGYQFSVSEGAVAVEGIVYRDLFPNDLDALTRRERHSFNDNLRAICLDPSSIPSRSTSGTATRNPQFIEKREIVYEFAHGAKYTIDSKEAEITRKGGVPNESRIYNRREARTDILSLSQVAPNYLMETVKGTVIDIYGNILDLNRNVLPAGKEKNLSFITNENKEDAFIRLREIERKSIAFHYELNVRKGNPPDARGQQPSKPTLPPLPDINSNEAWARSRSKFFFDIDKEGQFKLNVPASSEKGNLPLLTRSESSSTINAGTQGDPLQFSLDKKSAENRDQRRDIYLDTVAFNGGSITIKDPDNETAFSTPIDRLTNQPIKHGTMYHDVTEVLAAHRCPVLYEYEPVNTLITTLQFPSNFVSKEIKVSGRDANAGGRSGSFNFDGSIEWNVGANTIDKQSLWLDAQGSIMGLIGRDLNNVSMGLSLTGDLLIEVGGADSGMSTLGPMTSNISDNRFRGKNFAHRAGAVDIRVWNSAGEYSVVRVDEFGATVLTPGSMSFVAGKNILFKAQQFNIDAEEIVLYSGDEGAQRVVQRSGRSIL